MVIYLQTNENGEMDDYVYTAFIGANHLGYAFKYFTNVNDIEYHPDILVVACVDDTITYFKNNNIPVPAAINLFDKLYDQKLISRKLHSTTLQSFLDNKHCPCFIRPADEIKLFPAGVIQRDSSKSFVLGIDLNPDTKILYSEVIDIESEYRVFFSNRKGIIGMKHYLGDFMIYPDNDYIKKVIEFVNGTGLMPLCYSADFGILADGTTELIEFNDAWSLGPYGLDGESYLRFLLDRWMEITRPNYAKIYT